jgi:hypothetical protein
MNVISSSITRVSVARNCFIAAKYTRRAVIVKHI